MSTALRFTLDEYDRMIEQGVFDDRPEEKMELVYGEIRTMSPPGPAHEDVIDLLARWSFESTLRDEVRIRVQNSIGIPELDSAPQPDVAWVREQSYRAGRPQSSDVLLLIEVSDSSLPDDRTTKAELYAEAGVSDYWIINLQDWGIEVYRNPANGRFQ